jgi:hypothetical protein
MVYYIKEIKPGNTQINRTLNTIHDSPVRHPLDVHNHADLWGIAPS